MQGWLSNKQESLCFSLDYQQTNLEGWQSTLPVENRPFSAKLSYHTKLATVWICLKSEGVPSDDWTKQLRIPKEEYQCQSQLA